MKTKDLLETNQTPNDIVKLLTDGHIRMSGQIKLESTDWVRGQTGPELQLSSDFEHGQELEVYQQGGRTKKIPVSGVNFVRFKGTSEQVPVKLNRGGNGLVVDEERYFNP